MSNLNVCSSGSSVVVNIISHRRFNSFDLVAVICSKHYSDWVNLHL